MSLRKQNKIGTKTVSLKPTELHDSTPQVRVYKRTRQRGGRKEENKCAGGDPLAVHGLRFEYGFLKYILNRSVNENYPTSLFCLRTGEGFKKKRRAFVHEK